MNKKILILVLAVAGAGAVGAGVLVWQRAEQRKALITSSLPPLPDVRDASYILQERLADAQKAAKDGKVEGLAELATVYHANGYLTEALACYEALETLQPDEPKWLHRHASILSGYGQVEAAVELWRGVAELAPDYLPAQLRMADSLLKNNQLADAAKVYEGVLKRTPDEPYSTLGLARIDLEQNRLEAARTKLEKVVETSKSQLGYDLIVTVYERLGQLERATALRGKYGTSGAFRDPADPWVDDLLEDCYDIFRISLGAGVASRNGDHASAVRMLERALQLAPKDVAPRFQLAGLYQQRGDMNAARQKFQECTQIDPDFSDAWIRLSSLLMDGGDAAGAEQVALTGLSHCPESPGLHLLRGRQLRKLGRATEAIPSFQTSIRLRPNEPDAYIELGSVYLEQGQTEEGVEQLKKGLETDPANPSPLLLLAYHAIQSKDRAAADRWLTQIARQPRVPQELADRLYGGYREAFGVNWKP